MQVVLTTDIKGIGKSGETKEVSAGYYRNFLARTGGAVHLNDPKARQLLQEARLKSASQESEAARSAALARSIDGKRVVIVAKASGAKLFGAVHEVEVAKALGLDKKLVHMESLKTLGEHKVILDLPHAQKAAVTVEIKAI